MPVHISGAAPVAVLPPHDLCCPARPRRTVRPGSDPMQQPASPPSPTSVRRPGPGPSPRPWAGGAGSPLHPRTPSRAHHRPAHDPRPAPRPPATHTALTCVALPALVVSGERGQPACGGGRPAAGLAPGGRGLPHLRCGVAHILDTGLLGGGRPASGLLDKVQTKRIARLLGGPAMHAGRGRRSLGTKEARRLLRSTSDTGCRDVRRRAVVRRDRSASAPGRLPTGRHRGGLRGAAAHRARRGPARCLRRCGHPAPPVERAPRRDRPDRSADQRCPLRGASAAWDSSWPRRLRKVLEGGCDRGRRCLSSGRRL